MRTPHAHGWIIGLAIGCTAIGAWARPPRDVFGGRQYEVGDAPMAMKGADIDGDGDVDLVIANRDSRDISVLRQTVGSGFLQEVRIPLGVPSEYMDTGDLNGDGRADVVTTSTQDHAVAVLLTDGMGGFHAPNIYLLTGEPTDIAIGHIDQDGKPDVVVVSRSSGTVRALMNLGDGSLAPATVIFNYPWSNFTCIAMGDLDGDTDHEIVLGPENGGGTLLLNTGAGVFSEKPIPGSMSRGVVLTDMDRDGDRDILAIPTHYSISVVLNNGNATFENGDSHDPRISSIKDVAAADLDGDGWPDAVVAARSTEISWNNGTGSFKNALPPVDRDGEGSAVVASDFDRDGDADIAVAHPDSDLVAIWWNDGEGTFPPSLQTYASAHSLVKLDFEGDGDLDLIAAPDSGSWFTSLRNDGSGAFSAVAASAGDSPLAAADGFDGVPQARWSDMSGVAAGDLNQDGIADLVKSNPAFSGIAVRFGTGAGTFGPASYYFDTFHQQTSALVLGDFDLDDDLDTIAALGNTGKVGVFLNDSTGAFVFGPSVTAASWIRDIEMSDFDLDGDMDLVCATPQLDAVEMFWNQGEGAFESVSLHAGSSPYALAVGDLNNDGLPDIMVGNVGPDAPEPPASGISVLINSGAGAFAPIVSYAAQGSCTSVDLTDLDADGDPDVVAAFVGSHGVRVFLNDGLATLADSGLFLCGGRPADGPESIVAGDFNGDARSDVCVATYTSWGTVTTMLNQFQRQTFCPADVDGDGYANASDFSVLAAHFGELVPPGTLGDLDGDGFVTISDFSILAADFGCGP